MAKCEKCGAEVPQEDLSEVQGLKLCEICEMNSIKPPTKINL